MTKIKEGRLNIRLSTKRLDKLREFAEARDKTITSIVEDWIDELKIPKAER